jgi:FixJ family two-component response regulator
MANRTAPALVLRDGDRGKLESMLRSTTLAAGLAQRARVVLLASDGMANYEIADRVGVSRPTVNLWRARYGERVWRVCRMRRGRVGDGRWTGRR